jgi:hypothetical protein
MPAEISKENGIGRGAPKPSEQYKMDRWKQQKSEEEPWLPLLISTSTKGLEGQRKPKL